MRKIKKVYIDSTLDSTSMKNSDSTPTRIHVSDLEDMVGKVYNIAIFLTVPLVNSNYCVSFHRVQLGVCTLNIIKHDFPHKWTGIIDSIQNYLNSADTNLWPGALLCLYQLNKNYE